MVESVNMDVASRNSATLDLQVGETMTRHCVFLMRTRADLNIGRSRGREQRIANQRFQQAACNWCWTNILQELAGGLTMTSPRQWLPTSFGLTHPRTMSDNNDKKLLDWCSERRHNEWRCLGLQAAWRLNYLCSGVSILLETACISWQILKTHDTKITSR